MRTGKWAPSKPLPATDNGSQQSPSTAPKKERMETVSQKQGRANGDSQVGKRARLGQRGDPCNGHRQLRPTLLAYRQWSKYFRIWLQWAGWSPWLQPLLKPGLHMCEYIYIYIYTYIYKYIHTFINNYMYVKSKLWNVRRDEPDADESVTLQVFILHLCSAAYRLVVYICIYIY